MGEGVKIGATNHNRASSFKLLDGGSCDGAGEAFQDVRRGRSFAFGREEVVLQSVGDAGQRPDALAALDALVNCGGFGKGSLIINEGKDMVRILIVMCTLQGGADHLDGRMGFTRSLNHGYNTFGTLI